MKKIIATILTLSILLGTSLESVSAASNFKDINEKDWFYESIMVLSGKGIVDGYEDGTFRPSDLMTTDQFVKMMVVSLGYTNGNLKTSDYIDKAMEVGILKKGDFATYSVPIKRSEMAMLSVRMIELLEGKKLYKYDQIGDDTILTQINDRSTIPDQQLNYVCNAYELGIVSGYPDGSFGGNAGLKRSEGCNVIRRIIDASQRVPFVYTGIQIKDILDANDVSSLDFQILINTDGDLSQQYIQCQEFLIKAIGDDLTERVMEVVKTKTKSDHTITPIYFERNNGEKILVTSSSDDSLITISDF